MVQMPTGTGKTGVMAVTVVIQAQTRPCLVVCLSRALVNQLTADICGEAVNRPFNCGLLSSYHSSSLQ